MRLGRRSQVLAPGYGWCGQCETPWKFVHGHNTRYGEKGMGLFPLCEQCWAELSILQRLPYYHCLVSYWHAHGWAQVSFDEEWAQVRTAVLEGR